MAAVHLVLSGALWKYPQYLQPLSAAVADGVKKREDVRIESATNIDFNLIEVEPLES